MWNVKKTLAHLFPYSNSTPDVFSFIHRLAIVEQFLNDRPTFALEQTYFFPDMFRIATLQQAKRNDNQIISDLFIPTTQTMKDVISLQCKDSQKLLNILASELANKLLNYKNINTIHIPQEGNYVYLPSRIKKKNYPSLLSALGRVLKVSNTTLTIKLSNGQTVVRNMSDKFH